MQTMLDNKFAELIQKDEISTPTGNGQHEGKRRVVSNCSLKFRWISLNDNILQGPDLTSNLFGVLIRFRQEAIALVADIWQMFYKVRVPEHHANFLRYFWFNETKTDIV